MTRPYTPEMLAERWDCSADTVRAMIRGGTLPDARRGERTRPSAISLAAVARHSDEK